MRRLRLGSLRRARACALPGELQDGCQRVLEAHVQQPVRLVQHKERQRGGAECGAAAQMVQQPPGRGHQDAHATTQPRLLLLTVLATRHAAGHQPRERLQQRGQRGVDLLRQLAHGHDDEGGGAV